MTDEGDVDSRGAPVIRTRRLTKEFPRVRALDDLDLTVGSGVTGLVGANGAGKSTMIKILLGLLPPTSGEAEVLGHDVRTEGAAIRARVGYMPEHDCLPGDVNASEFVVHMGRMSGLPHAVARERAADVLRHVGLAEERYREMGGYSTGMKQRAKLAQALVHDPDLVLLDEPTNGLDPTSREDMLDLVRRIGTDFGIAVLVTSHLLGELERVSDHVIVLDAGRLLRSSATSEFTETTGTLLVEVLGSATERDLLGNALAGRGLRCHPVAGAVEVLPPPDGLHEGSDVRDLVRDTVIDLDLGLVRIQEGRHRIQDVFAPPEEAMQP
ncbi:ABC transporter ATP-binding protein [Arsenicicoccus sp. oral taxon 190]|uniref:ABC transporter ATP-binding protein n=1 Tax=Arsenicicoccus sp. oral taxon 190 TaxID=1658671 RepID=UPI00067A1AAF|nr:ABC transporter ATP-binding protein [Arsenicicoccus sp. oral taxon 190]AKT50607.1 ABC transporter [Arsenicicoccus sp. oral taxon 190]